MDANRLDKIAELVVKYLRNELNSEEYGMLEKWRKESDKQEEEFKRLCSEEFLREQRQQELLYSVCKAKKRFQQGIKKTVPGYLIRRWIQVAAVFVVLIGGTWLFLKQGQEVPESSGRIVCGSARARLTLGDGQVIELGENTKQVIGQQGVELNINKDLLRYVTQGENRIEEYNTLEIPRRGEYKVILADGTKVWLNSETVLRYPQVFSGNSRQVYLTGEAFFEVARDTTKPFIVHLNGQEKIKVLGTSFNVHAYREEHEVYTTLVEGQVNIQTKGQQLDLLPGEQGVWNRSESRLKKQAVDVRPYMAWKDGRFVFKKERLENIMSTVTRWYDVNVIYENETIKDLSFSGNVERYDDFDKIITMLEMTRMVNFKVEKNNIFISEIK